MAEVSPDEGGAYRPHVRGLVTGWRALLRQAAGPTGGRDLDRAVFTWLDAALRRQYLKAVIFDTLRHAVNVPGPEGPTLRTSAQWWVQGQDRPYSKEKDDLKRELSALLDQYLIARRSQPAAPLPSSPNGAVDVAHALVHEDLLGAEVLHHGPVGMARAVRREGPWQSGPSKRRPGHWHHALGPGHQATARRAWYGAGLLRCLLRAPAGDRRGEQPRRETVSTPGGQRAPTPHRPVRTPGPRWPAPPSSAGFR